MITTTIRRVVSCFILSGQQKSRDSLKIAVFHRVDTMPTFPSHWAACSGSIEEDETPWQTACRELQEETSLKAQPSKQYGLYVDVPYKRTEERETIIRVYPFVVELPENHKLELKGTEHDYYKFVSVAELEDLEPAVPSLALAFHHATFGRYLKNTPDYVKEWASDYVNGAAFLAHSAVQLVKYNHADPNVIKMFRPSMVAITNAMTACTKTKSPGDVLESLRTATNNAIEYAVEEIAAFVKTKKQSNEEVTISTFSRSSTLARILQKLLQNGTKIKVVCSKSTPGNEGELMARDLDNAECISDEDMEDRIQLGCVDLLLVGCDCITETSVVNKVGTASLARAASDSPCKVYCCTDQFKQWQDIFPPPLEDIFEEVPKELFDRILMPPPEDECKEEREENANKKQRID